MKRDPVSSVSPAGTSTVPPSGRFPQSAIAWLRAQVELLPFCERIEPDAPA